LLLFSLLEELFELSVKLLSAELSELLLEELLLTLLSVVQFVAAAMYPASSSLPNWVAGDRGEKVVLRHGEKVESDGPQIVACILVVPTVAGSKEAAEILQSEILPIGTYVKFGLGFVRTTIPFSHP
jgi:hypothetical protein